MIGERLERFSRRPIGRIFRRIRTKIVDGCRGIVECNVV